MIRDLHIYCLILALISMPASAQTKHELEQKYGMDAEFFIPDKDIPQLEQQALGGDSESAKRLIDYYNSIHFDLAKIRYWTQIAAENGDVGAYMNLILLMSSNFPPKQAEQQRYDDERLCFWVGKALAAGIKPNQFYMTARKKCNLVLKSQ